MFLIKQGLSPEFRGAVSGSSHGSYILGSNECSLRLSSREENFYIHEIKPPYNQGARKSDCWVFLESSIKALNALDSPF